MAKIELNDFVRYGKLFSCYGKLLKEDTQKIMTDYFEYNMTLVEIAKERDISRQAVLDCINKSCKKLDTFENALKVVETKEEIVKGLQEIESSGDEKIKEKVEKLLRKL